MAYVMMGPILLLLMLLLLLLLLMRMRMRIINIVHVYEMMF